MQTPYPSKSSLISQTLKGELEAQILASLNEAHPLYAIDNIDTDEFNTTHASKTVGIHLRSTTHSTQKAKSASEINSDNPAQRFKVAMIHKGHTFGNIEVVLPSKDIDIGDLKAKFQHIAEDMAFFIQNEQNYRHIKPSQANELTWLGNSDELNKVRDFISKVARVNFPVLIEGQSGTGKLIAAYQIHSQSQQANNPFIETHCCQWDPDETLRIIQTLCDKAYGGTLFLRSIDTLSDEQITQVIQYWRHTIDNAPNQKTIRLIASLSQQKNTDECAWKELDYLSICLPSLKQRKADIKALTQHYLSSLKHIKSIQISDACLSLFEGFNWLGNAEQLERFVSKLVVMSDNKEITMANAIALIPQLQSTSSSPVSSSITNKLNSAPESIAYQIACGNSADLPAQHPALYKAMHYLAKHFSHSLSITELSNNAYVSPSHLSYLFKKHIGQSFKQLLIQTRIEKAKILLSSQSQQNISQIAISIGFHDLSHFEKTFKRNVGISPGMYRKHHL